jgi:SAM-dependent methyltransferase
VPSSDFEQIETIVRILQAADPQSVLDIGVGFGKYGFLMREYLEVWSGTGEYGQWQRRLEGVEAFEKYVTPLHRYIYDRLHIGNALDVLPRLSGSFDLVLLIDVIEHFSYADGERLLAECERVGRTVLIASPRLFFEQEAVFDNPYEQHRSHWSGRALAGDRGFSLAVGRSWIALRGRDAVQVAKAFQRRLRIDRVKNRFPRSARAAITFLQRVRGTGSPP